MHVDTMDYQDPDEALQHIPAGEYVAKIVKIKPGLDTKNVEEERWNVTFEILEGEHKGFRIYDNWIFNSENVHAQSRQVLIQHRIGGYPKRYTGDIDPDVFGGKKIYITLELNNHEGKTRSKPTFSGYRAFVDDVDNVDDIPEHQIPY